MGDPAPTPDPTPTPDPAPAPPPTDPAPSNPDDGKGGKDAILADLAKERDKRQALEQQVQDLLPLRDQFAAIAKVFNPGDGDAPPDPVKLAEQIASEQGKAAEAEARAANAERQLAVFKAAAHHEGNALALIDSTSFMASIKDVDPNDAEKVGEAIRAAVEANPLFKATPATPPFPGGPRPPAPPARAGSLSEAVAARLASQNR